MHRVANALLFLMLAVPACRAEEFVIGQKDKAFSRETAVLKAGDRVKFVNDDTIPHNVLVTGPDDQTRNSGVQAPGESATLSFDKPGTYAIECGIHPHMKMTVTVK